MYIIDVNYFGSDCSNIAEINHVLCNQFFRKIKLQIDDF